MEPLIFLVTVIVFLMLNLAIFLPVVKERDLLKEVFFKSDKIYWDGGGDISYSVCLSMTKQHTNNTIYCDFDQFKKDFSAVKSWRYDAYYDSLMGKNNDGYIHASILSINNVGYLPINQDEFRKISIFIRSYIDLNFK